MFVDRSARICTCELLRQFNLGLVTFADLVQSFPESDDPVIKAISDSLEQSFTTSFERDETCALQPPRRLARHLARWIMFLKTDMPYSWPAIGAPGVRPLQYSWLSRAIKMDFRQRQFMRAGDIRFWPFPDEYTFKTIRGQPTYLIG